MIENVGVLEQLERGPIETTCLMDDALLAKCGFKSLHRGTAGLDDVVATPRSGWVMWSAITLRDHTLPQGGP